ncbi:hypothetical protein SAMN02745181_0318 [Rubritalea squalenifaciens DSM 18772]|uniref:Uncharacterized protein n=1 Tax=Rubritalea squalenifaciens DSM 18772 TaxID=1123071 RepID=A0A1M6BVF1_9BACT|nr:hypothetical protein SAMN02745181_0318 [Rubritalea squalenifaciens DSM 18772]
MFHQAGLYSLFVILDSPRRGTTDEKDVIAVRGASVPEEILQQLD